ncbi:hypothetical protein ES703_33195 [subsurface metagenome]
MDIGLRIAFFIMFLVIVVGFLIAIQYLKDIERLILDMFVWMQRMRHEDQKKD